MNKFLWKVENGCLDYTPITTIENAITQKQAQEISQQILEFSKTEFSKQHEKFATDNNPGCWRGFAPCALAASGIHSAWADWLCWQVRTARVDCALSFDTGLSRLHSSKEEVPLKNCI